MTENGDPQRISQPSRSYFSRRASCKVSATAAEGYGWITRGKIVHENIRRYVEFWYKKVKNICLFELNRVYFIKLIGIRMNFKVFFLMQCFTGLWRHVEQWMTSSAGYSSRFGILSPIHIQGGIRNPVYRLIREVCDKMLFLHNNRQNKQVHFYLLFAFYYVILFNMRCNSRFRTRGFHW